MKTRGANPDKLTLPRPTLHCEEARVWCQYVGGRHDPPPPTMHLGWFCSFCVFLQWHFWCYMQSLSVYLFDAVYELFLRYSLWSGKCQLIRVCMTQFSSGAAIVLFTCFKIFGHAHTMDFSLGKCIVDWWQKSQAIRLDLCHGFSLCMRRVDSLICMCRIHVHK